MPRDPEELYEALKGWTPPPGRLDLFRQVFLAVLELHKPEPVWHQSRVKLCHGCDMDGYETEYPEWPCRTVRTIAHVLGEPTDA
jgi:hypothetical protein